MRSCITMVSIVLIILCSTAQSGTCWAESAPGQESSNVPSAEGPIRKQLILKPFLLLGYNMQEIFTHPNSATSPFFTELSVFHNWRVGLGLRITSFLSLELAYNSLARTYRLEDQKISDSVTVSSTNVNMFTHMVYFVGTFYTPAIDLRFGTLEFTASVGVAGIFGLEHTSSSYELPTTSQGAQFMGGVGVVFGFPKFVSIRGFAEVITLGQNVLDIPFVLNYGVAINVYLL